MILIIRRINLDSNMKIIINKFIINIKHKKKKKNIYIYIYIYIKS